MENIVMKKEIKKYKFGDWEEKEDILILETPLTIFFNDDEIVTLLCTPMYIEDLSVGFLAAEGFLKTPEDIDAVTGDYDKGIVWINGKTPPISSRKTFLKRFLTSGCGKGTTFYNFADTRILSVPVTNNLIKAETILEGAKKLQMHSSLFKETGGTHGALLIQDRNEICFREDIGRHNAVDKILGKCFRERISLSDKCLITTGRISSEILTKTAKMDIGILVSRSAPTSLAVELAEELGVTLVGFARGERMNVYTYPERIIK